jgi:hypothetical protein
LEKVVNKFWHILAFLLATFSGAFAAPNGSIQSSVAVCDPNAPSICEAFAGGTPTSAQATCTTDGTVQVLASITTAKAGRFLSNVSGATIYIGPSGVSDTTGFPVPTGTVLDVTKSTSALYCATASSTAVLNTLQY